MRSSNIGGQAVLEGIMMRNGGKYSVAVRKPDGEIESEVWDYHSVIPWKVLLKIPFIRGIFNFVDSLVLGMKTLMYSASFFEEEEDDLISREELNEKIGGSRQEMERIENELKMVSYHLTKGEQLENILNNTFKEIEDITDVHQMTNQQLKRLIQKIEVDKEGNVDIYLRLLGDLGLDESVLIEENETVLNCDDQT